MSGLCLACVCHANCVQALLAAGEDGAAAAEADAAQAHAGGMVTPQGAPPEPREPADPQAEEAAELVEDEGADADGKPSGRDYPEDDAPLASLIKGADKDKNKDLLKKPAEARRARAS